MKPSSANTIKLAILAVLLLGACDFASLLSSPTPTLPAEQLLTPTPAGTPTVTPDYPPLPSATRYAPPDPEPGVFGDPDLGVSLHYPPRWSASSDESNPTVLTWLMSPGNEVIAVLFFGPVGPDDTLESVAADVLDGSLGALQDLEVVSDETIQLSDGLQAWSTVATGVRPSDGVALKVSLTTAIRGGLAFTLMMYATPARYNDDASDIADVVASLHLEAPLVQGISRRDALVLAGGESTNPREYDPATTHGSGDKRVYSGLVSFDAEMNLVGDLAESWRVEGGTVYAFTLRPDARFHNGRPVTAHDVVYSWERAADPETDSDTVLSYLGDIVGVEAMHAGEADHVAGLEVVDEHTLRVTVDAPKPYFLYKLTYPTAFVVDRANVESGPDWYRTPNGTGPYRLARWDRFEMMLYERNEDYHLDLPAIPYVVVHLFTGVGIRLYEAGDIDVTGVSVYDVPRALDPEDPLHEDLLVGVDMCTNYVTFDVEQPPFDDVQVRQAFTMAFDRQKYIDVVLRGVGLPARGLYPPALPGYDASLEGLPFDPVRARELLAESAYGGPEGLPPIVYTSAGRGSYVASDVAAMVEMWERNLGVSITVENLEPDRYRDEIDAGNHGQLFGSGWCADYPDAQNFGDTLFYTGTEYNEGHYSNPEVDALLERARVEQDVQERLRLYQEAERLIVEDAPAVFTVHSLSHVLVKPHVKGYVLTPVDVPLERFLWIDPDLIE